MTGFSSPSYVYIYTHTCIYIYVEICSFISPSLLAHPGGGREIGSLNRTQDAFAIGKLKNSGTLPLGPAEIFAEPFVVDWFSQSSTVKYRRVKPSIVY